MAAKIDVPAFDREMRKFDKNLQKLEDLAGDTSGKILWKYSSQFANGLVSATQPKGAANNALKKGEKATARDVARAYPSPSKVWLNLKMRRGLGVANAFWKAWKDRDLEGVRKSFRGTGARLEAQRNFDGGRHHQAGRDARGRYTRTSGLFVFDRGAVKKYSEMVVGRVMWAKAGWVARFNPPGGKAKIAESVKRHRTAPNTITDKTKGSRSLRAIWFGNGVDYLKKVFKEGDALRVLFRVSKKVSTDLEKQLVKVSDKNL